MKGWRTIVFFTGIGILGIVTTLGSIDIKEFLLPLFCHIPADADPVGSCADNIIKLAGIWTSFLGAAGVLLRAITSSAVFKSLNDE